MNVKSVEAGVGLQWLAEGWRIFKLNPGMWIVLTIVYVVIMVVLGFIPLVGQLVAALISPALGGGLLYGARKLDLGEDLAIGHLFLGLTDAQKRTPFLILGALYLGLVILAFILAAIFGGGTAMLTAAGGGVAAAGGALAMALVVSLVVLIAVMAFLYASPIVMFTDVPPVEAVKASIEACLKNMMPMLVLGLVWIVLAVVATIPALLGWFVLAPVTVAAVYASYKDIFGTTA